ncbi:MAG: nucleoside phosphorylase [Bacteroidales bacterium]|nr:nucleoside phosphorylase [Bacteroidales bacterium]
MLTFEASELVLQPDGSVYHLKLFPDEIADKIILVGDPSRADMVASFFDKVTVKKENREIFTRTGFYKNKTISVLSTGMGPDNIDIVINELDVLANFDLQKSTVKDHVKSLTLVRIGTSGALQPDISLGAFVFSSYALGLDGLLHFYADSEKVRDIAMEKAIEKHTRWDTNWPSPYVVSADLTLFQQLVGDHPSGITVTAGGFYGPQGRKLRLPVKHPEFNELISSFSWNNLRCTNYEMETSALYGLSKMMGHKACTACVIIANRKRGEFLSDYKPYVEKLIHHVLENI